MSTKPITKPRVKPVTFRCEAPKATSVAVVGDFNKWNRLATPLTKDPDGVWSAKLDLPPGRYEYKFVVDGCWCCEPDEPDACCPGPGRVPNAFGTMNRVIQVR